VSGQSSPRILLIAADLRTRSLVLAQLEAQGFDVSAEPGLRAAARTISLGRPAPSLVFLDTRGDEHATPENVAALLGAAPAAKAIVLAGTHDLSAWDPLRPRLAALLHRPVSIGQIVEAITHAL
jgi:DNA-binding NtrC family response regulator